MLQEATERGETPEVSKHADPLGTCRVAYGAIAWVVLVVAWWQVLSRGPQTWVSQLVVPVLAVVVVTAMTLGWVRHNLGIYQRKGPRHGLPEADAPWTTDSLGRRLEFTPGLEDARFVRLDLHGDVKRYEVAP